MTNVSLEFVRHDSSPAAGLGETGTAETVEALRARIEALEAMNQAKDLFLGRMLHDIRNPLGGIIGFAATLLMRLPGPLNAAQERQINTIETCAKDLLDQLNRLPLALRIETGTIAAQAGTMSWRAVAEEVEREWRERAEAKGLAFEIAVPDDDLTLRTDPWIVGEIVSRLVANAVAYTERGGITVAGDRPPEAPGGIRIEIRDTGAGLSPENQGKLFQPFTQLVAAPGRHRQGPGHGLYQARRLAGLIGGHVSCASVLGQGSVFTLTLPEGAPNGADSGD